MEKLLTDMERLDLKERQITATMEHEICVAGQFSADWNQALREIEDSRRVILLERRSFQVEIEKDGD